MDRLFRLYEDNRKFRLFVTDIVPEVEEAYVGEAGRLTSQSGEGECPDTMSFMMNMSDGRRPEMYFDSMTDLMKTTVIPRFALSVWKYIKHMDPEERTFKTILELLRKSTVTGEYQYLLPEKYLEVGSGNMWCRCLTDDRNRIRRDVLYWTGRTFAYIYRLYEAPSHSKKEVREVWKEEQRLIDACLRVPEAAVQDMSGKEQGAKLKEERELPVRIKHYLDQKVFGQEEAKKTVTMAVVSFLKTGRRSPILLAGPTGCGKTFLLETLAGMPELQDSLGFSCYCVTELTENGFHGDDMSDLIRKVHKDFGEKKKGILFLDEVDKVLAYGSSDSRGNDVNQNIINQLLTAVAGNRGNYCMDTNNILFIFGGAFENLEEEKREQNRHSIGFRSPVDHTSGHGLGNESEDGGSNRDLLAEADLFRKGSRQFWGRIGRIVVMKPLDRDSLRRIFEDEKYGVLMNKKREFAEWGLDLEWDESFVDAAIDQVASSRQGARCCASLIERTIGTYDYDLCESGMSRMTLSEAVLKGAKPVCC